MDNLDDILNGSEEPQAVTPEAPEAQAEAPAAETPQAEAETPKQPRGPDGKFAPKGEEVVAPPATEEPAFDHAATIGERRRRQEAEARIAELERQVAQYQQPQTPPPDVFEDTEGWQRHFGGQVVNEAVNAATMNARLDMSEMMVRQAQPDFEEKKAAFLELMRDTPGLQQKALADAHPWNFAYNYVTNKQRMDELAATNVTELEAKLREKITAELAAAQPAPAVVPDSLATAQSARGSVAAYEPPSLEQILKG